MAARIADGQSIDNHIMGVVMDGAEPPQDKFHGLVAFRGIFRIFQQDVVRLFQINVFAILLEIFRLPPFPTASHRAMVEDDISDIDCRPFSHLVVQRPDSGGRLFPIRRIAGGNRRLDERQRPVAIMTVNQRLLF